MRASTASLGTAPARASAAALRPTVPRTKATAASSAGVLERERAPHVDVIVTPSYADLLPSMDEASKAGFADYESATQRMEDLERLSAELLDNLNELNSASEALDAMPMPDFFNLQNQEERRAKRAAAREARKTRASATQTQAASATRQGAAPSTTVTSSRTQPTPVSTATGPRLSGSSIAVPAPKPSTTAAAAAGPSLAAPATSSSASISRSPLPSASAQAPAPYERLGQTRALAAGPSIRAAGPSIRTAGPSIRTAGPSLVARSASTPPGTQAEPSAWAREANARRAGARNTRRAATLASTDATTSRSRSSGASGSGDGTTLFMKKSGTHDLLSGISEKDLASIVKDALFLERLKDELRGVLKRDPSTVEFATAVNMDPESFMARLNAGQHAKSVMLQANYRLVISICKKYQHRGMAIQDLITEGIRGLLTGVEKFDADKGFRFSTYAHWWIRQAVTRSLASQTREVRMPTHIADLISRIKHAKAELMEQFNREPTMDELSAAVQLPAKRINEVLAMGWQSSSLDAAMGSDEDANTMKDLLQDDRGTPDDNLQETMFSREIDSMLSDLSEREAGVIKMRFGLGGEDIVTLEEIGTHFNLTRERIRQIEAKAIRKLKQKHSFFAGVLAEYSAAEADADIAPRTSQGTNKSK